jgi:hypothetical protein
VERKTAASRGTKAFLVERYVPGITSAQLAAVERRLRRAVRDLAAAGAQIRLVSSAFVPAEEVVLSVFEASAEETVIEANVRSGARVDRVQPAELTGEEAEGHGER